MSDDGPDGHPDDIDPTDEEAIAIEIGIDLDEITNFGGEGESEQDEGGAKSRHPTARRLLP